MADLSAVLRAFPPGPLRFGGLRVTVGPVCVCTLSGDSSSWSASQNGCWSLLEKF